MKTFFTSDLHFGHTNVIKFDDRPYATAEDMEEALIGNWNKKVSQEDRIYILGDMFYKCTGEQVRRILKTLHGQKYLIRGNHDRWSNVEENRVLLFGVADYLKAAIELEDGTTRGVVLCHYFIPFYERHYHNGIMLHGHSHVTREYEEEERLKRELNDRGLCCEAYNVGCMHWNYEPVTLDEILASGKYEA